LINYHPISSFILYICQTIGIVYFQKETSPLSIPETLDTISKRRNNPFGFVISELNTKTTLPFPIFRFNKRKKIKNKATGTFGNAKLLRTKVKKDIGYINSGDAGLLMRKALMRYKAERGREGLPWRATCFPVKLPYGFARLPFSSSWSGHLFFLASISRLEHQLSPTLSPPLAEIKTIFSTKDKRKTISPNKTAKKSDQSNPQQQHPQ
jgi:hypothetical protein